MSNIGKRFLCQKNDGTVDIIIMVMDVTPEAVIAKWSLEDQEKVVYTREITVDDLPPTREFRNAWSDITESSSIDIDAAKAKELQLGKLRLERNKRLDALDPLVLKALENNDTATLTNLKIERQALRDATEPLKALQVSGAASEEVLNEIRTKGSLPE